MSHPLWNALLLDLPSLPLWILFLVGMGVSIHRWKTHPRVSLLALMAFTLGLVSLGLGLWYRAWLFQAPAFVPSSGASRNLVAMPGLGGGHRLMVMGSLVNLGQVVLKTASWALALFAIFLRR